MKKTTFIRTMICVLLSALMMLSAVSCFGKAQNNQQAETLATAEGEVTTQAGGADSQPTDEEVYKPEEKDYNREFIIMSEIPTYFGMADDYKLGDGSIMDDAVYTRAQLMNEKYGVDIVVKKGATDEYSVPVNAGEYVCDVLTINAQKNFSLVLQNLMVDLATLESLNLEAPYWDQRIQTDCAVGDRIYLMEGDFSYYDELRTYSMLYNDQLYMDYGYYETYGTPYSMVENGTWTFDKMMTMMNDLYRDLNDNGQKDEFDQYGIVGAMNMQWCCFLGSGLKTISTNNGELTLNIKDNTYYNQVYDVLEDVMTRLTNNDDVLQPQLLKEPSTDVWTAASNVFENDRALFRATTISAAIRLGNMSSRFGLLPMPTYQEGTGVYYGWLPGDSHAPLTMARTVADKEETGEILEALCYHSRYGSNSLFNAYFETFRISKFCETEEDLKMMNLIIENKAYDLDFIAHVTGFADVIWRMGMDEDISAFASNFATKRSAAPAAMDEFILKVLELD